MHSEEVRRPVWLMAELRRHRETEQDRARGSDFQAHRRAAAKAPRWDDNGPGRETMNTAEEEAQCAGSVGPFRIPVRAGTSSNGRREPC